MALTRPFGLAYCAMGTAFGWLWSNRIAHVAVGYEDVVFDQRVGSATFLPLWSYAVGYPHLVRILAVPITKPIDFSVVREGDCTPLRTCVVSARRILRTGGVCAPHSILSAPGLCRWLVAHGAVVHDLD